MMRKPIINKKQIEWLMDFQDFLEYKVLPHLTLVLGTDAEDQSFYAWGITERSPEEHILELRYGDDDGYYESCEVCIENLAESDWKGAINKREEAARLEAERINKELEEKDAEQKKEARRIRYEELKKEFEPEN